MIPPSWAAGLILLSVCAAGIWLDIRTRRLPNWLCLLALATGVAATMVLGQTSAIGSHLLHMALALFAGMALFQFGVIGGGDAKFYAAIAAWFPLSMAFYLLVSVSLAGLAGVLVWLGWRRLAGIRMRRDSGNDADKFPYGIAIGLGGILAILPRLGQS